MTLDQRFQGGARGQNGGQIIFLLLLFFLNEIIQFKQKVLFRINFLSVTSDLDSVP